MLLYLLLLPQVQVPKHVLRVFSDEGGQEKVEIQVLLPGECCCGPRHLNSLVETVSGLCWPRGRQVMHACVRQHSMLAMFDCY